MVAISLNDKVEHRCPFCKKVAYFAYRQVIDNTDVYVCAHCPFDVHIYKYNEFDGISMKVPLKEKYYIIDFWRPEGHCLISEVTKKGSWIETVLELSYDPIDWNPANIITKLQMVLTFL